MQTQFVTRVEFQEKMDKIDQKFEDLGSIMTREFDKVYDRFDAVDRRFDAMDMRFNRVDHSIQIIDGNISLMAKYLNAMGKHMGMKDEILFKSS